MLLTRTAAPVDFITDADVKAHLRIDHTYDDATVAAVRVAAIEALDGRHGYLRRAICTQTWVWKLPCFPTGTELHFPLPPLQSVTSVEYYDDAGALQTFDASKYRVHPDAYVGYMKLRPAFSWPSHEERDDAVTITFVAGYGDATAIPRQIKQAALIRCGALYTTRGDSDGGGGGGMTEAQIRQAGFTETEERLLMPFRLKEFEQSYVEYWRAAGTRPHR